MSLMPPKSKFTKEEIIAAALEIAAENGIEAVTARAVGERLGSSARPIFTVFQNMNQVFGEVKSAARELYDKYIDAGLKEEIAFKGVGMQYIRFAAEQPKLFQFLFMSEQPADQTINSILPAIDSNYREILSSITDRYAVDDETALSFYRHMWIYSHGIAALCATRTLELKESEISEMLTDIFVSLLIKNKSQNEKQP